MYETGLKLSTLHFSALRPSKRRLQAQQAEAERQYEVLKFIATLQEGTVSDVTVRSGQAPSSAALHAKLATQRNGTFDVMGEWSWNGRPDRNGYQSGEWNFTIGNDANTLVLTGFSNNPAEINLVRYSDTDVPEGTHYDKPHIALLNLRTVFQQLLSGVTNNPVTRLIDYKTLKSAVLPAEAKEKAEQVIRNLNMNAMDQVLHQLSESSIALQNVQVARKLNQHTLEADLILNGQPGYRIQASFPDKTVSVETRPLHMTPTSSLPFTVRQLDKMPSFTISGLDDQGEPFELRYHHFNQAYSPASFSYSQDGHSVIVTQDERPWYFHLKPNLERLLLAELECAN